jgi:molybdenum cofactor cytidylyltransferase
MKFGSVPLDRAEGAILAHSVGLEGGKRLRKGRVIGAEDVAALAASGLRDVIVAQLGPDDVAEDAAAQALAAALVPDPDAAGLILTAPFTGRVNLLASGPGVAVLDVAALEAANRVHPMITVATVPAFQQMRDGGMVATIKIISYGVPAAALKDACAAARGAILLAPPVIGSAALVITEISGGAGDKGRAAVAERVAAFGVTLPEPAMVCHAVVPLRDALLQCEAELLLILTGSATSDIEDVAPTAVREAGGSVARFGMPVDPGNLLFIGNLRGRPVIGLPGCARAPALNGADWVLARVMCGIPVTDADISAMGVGGLLKEIPSRPQPRRGSGKARGREGE